jgi:hypothetical protein
MYNMVLESLISCFGQTLGYEQRLNTNLFQFLDSAEYFLDHVQTIAQADYIPSFEDTLKLSQEATECKHLSFFEVNMPVELAGSRNLRKRLKEVFPKTTGILFIAAISEYDQVMWEDGKANRLDDAVNWSKKLEGLPIILFLTKAMTRPNRHI